MHFAHHLQRALGTLERAGLMRSPRVLDSAQGPEIRIGGRSVVNLCSNDYLGLAADPALVRSTVEALSRWGLGGGASRHIAGSLRPHLDAQRSLADFVSLPSALLFATGYAANVGIIPALVGPGDVVFSDALNHASLIDGCRLSRAAVHVYPHRDAARLAQLLAENRPTDGAALVITESLFSMDGDEAPLAALRAAADRHGAGLLVDEAHALGVLGPAGRGLCAEQGVVPDLLVGTLGKAFGAGGAFCAGTAEAIQLVENRARSYVFSTAPPPALAVAAAAAVVRASGMTERRQRLIATANELRRGLTGLGYRVSAGRSPILPLHVGDPRLTMAFSADLLERGVFVHGIRPPTVARGTSRLRITAMATHTAAHLERVLAAFAELRQRYHLG